MGEIQIRNGRRKEGKTKETEHGTKQEKPIK
jgi:hypothetical protein